MSAREWTLYSQAALLAQDRALARDLLLRGHVEHPDEASLMVLLGQNTLKLQDPIAAKRWLLQALAIEPDNQRGQELLQMIPAAATDATKPK